MQASPEGIVIVSGHKPSFVFVVALSLSFLVFVPVPAQSYAGPGSGVEFIPQFLALLAYVGAAAGAILLWPFFRLMRWIREQKTGVRGQETGIRSQETEDVTHRAPHDS
jgi:hypothetical protein